MIDYRTAKTEHELEMFHQHNVDEMGRDQYHEKGEYLWDSYVKNTQRIKTYTMVKQELEALKHDNDIERAHEQADAMLCDLLKVLGYEDIVAMFEEIDKYYA